MTYDYIIVGAGAAGCVLAYRLSENPANRILLLEFGGTDMNPMHYVPKGFYFTLPTGRYTYTYPTKPFKSDGSGEGWTRGKVLGGSTTVNGMMYTRGFQADYDRLVELGNPGWGWDQILPVYRKMEDHQLGASDTRGTGGPYGVSIPDARDEVTDALFAAGRNYGWKVVADANEEDVERIGFTPSSIRNGRRTSAASAFLRPAKGRPNLTVMTRTRAAYLLFDGQRVVGVRTARKGRVEDFKASKEVLVSGGTIESTMLLERSGIGHPAVLKAAGVNVVAESPNVGERVIEQRGLQMQVKLKDRIGTTQRLNTLPKQLWEGFKYLFTRKGPIATAGYDVICGFKSSPEMARPDVQGLFVPMALDMTSFDAVKLAKHSGIMFLGYQIHPTTKSSLHITGKRPGNPPVIDPHYLESEVDRKATAAILGCARAILAQSPVADLIAEEEYPGPSVSAEEEVVRYAHDSSGTIYHAVGANAMGPNDDDVVDSQLRVRGVSGLRVIDTSVFPEQPSGNSAAPTMALAWRAADLILGAA
jgi:choline dehydrogenase-like flavoprotein